MTSHVRTLAIWGPRLIGVAMAGFVALFALDAFNGGPLSGALQDFTVHLIPAVIVGLVVAIGWRYPWAGAIGFGALAIAYAAMVPNRPDWILAISGPLSFVAVLFAMSGAIGRHPKTG